MSRFETETLTQEDNLSGLALMNSQWVEGAMDHTPHRRVILDLDILPRKDQYTVSRKGRPTMGTSGVSAIIPSFCSTSWGIAKEPFPGKATWQRPQCRGLAFPRNGWQQVLDPVVKRCQKKGLRLLFRGDAVLPWKDQARAEVLVSMEMLTRMLERISRLRLVPG